MFCPLCHAEYRQGFTTCADCGVALEEAAPISPTDDDTFSPRPTEAVWQGMDERDAVRVQEALLRLGLPAEIGRQGTRAYEVRVPSWVVEPVRSDYFEALQPGAPASSHWPQGKEGSRLECPLCFEDYTVPLRFCPKCIVALADPDQVEEAAKVWEGDHPGDAYRVHQAMLGSSIPFHIVGSESYLSHVLLPRTPLQPQRYSLRVLPQDEAAARRIVEALPLANVTELDVLPSEQAAAPDPLDGEEEPEITWVLVWSGTSEEALEALRFALRENGIQMRVADADGAYGQRQLHVPESDEPQAQTIVRQILEGEVPPELDLTSDPDAVDSRE
jgi:hypothetical protein